MRSTAAVCALASGRRQRGSCDPMLGFSLTRRGILAGVGKGKWFSYYQPPINHQSHNAINLLALILHAAQGRRLWVPIGRSQSPPGMVYHVPSHPLLWYGLPCPFPVPLPFPYMVWSAISGLQPGLAPNSINLVSEFLEKNVTISGLQGLQKPGPRTTSPGP